MNKLLASIKKEVLLLIHDKVGLILMYLMPILLVFIITIVQDSAFRIINENKIEILFANDDEGVFGDSLSNMLSQSGTFNIDIKRNISEKEILRIIQEDDKMLAIQIPKNFSEKLNAKASQISGSMLHEFGLVKEVENKKIVMDSLKMFFDPILQQNYRYSLLSSIYTYLGVLENKLLINTLYIEMGYDKLPQSLESQFLENKLTIKQIAATSSGKDIVPNSSQHNVPAWSLFAMFFMVISLGGNIVKERLSGSFVRLQTIPTSFSYLLVSKMLTYLFVALTQLTTIFMLGRFVFPLIGLPELNIPSNILGLVLVSVGSALAAVSFAMLVGTFAKTQEQAGGVGSISIVMLSAIGGVWVPSFIMPDYMKTIGSISPLHWCLEGYYVLFLKGGDWHLLVPTFIFLSIFIVSCQFLIFIKLKLQNYI